MHRRAGYLFVLPAVLFLGALLVYPVVLNVVMSFQNVTAATMLSGSDWVGFENYRAAFTDELFVKAAWHSAAFAGVSVLVQLALGFALALFYAQAFPGARVFRSLFMVAYAIPVVVSAELFRWLLAEPEWLVDPDLVLPALIGIQCWLGVPFVMVSLLAGLMAVPRVLHEAAMIDGASAFQRFRAVTWPLLRPTLLATAVLSAIFTLKSFDLVWIATQGGPANASEILPTLAYRLVFSSFLFGKGAAILNVVFAALFVLSLLYLWAQRREAR